MQSKNSKCNCNSGKIYKRCCMKNPNSNYPKLINSKDKISENLKKSMKIIDYPTKVFSNKIEPKKDITYVSYLKNIPIKIKDKVADLVLKFPPNDSECIRYSQFISSSIDDVKVEIGLYNFEELQNSFKSKIPNENGWFEMELIRGFKTSLYIENGVVWGIHCWNSYKNIHFDCLRDLRIKKRLPNQWIRYKIIDSINFNFDSVDTKINILNKLKNDIKMGRLLRFN